MRLRILINISLLLLLVWVRAFAQKPELVVQTGHSNAIRSITFSPDGKTLASGGDDHTIRFWDVASGRMLRRLGENSGKIVTATFTPDGKTLAGISEDGTIKLWDVTNGTELRTFKQQGGFFPAAAFSPDSKTLVVCFGGAIEGNKRIPGEVRIWDLVNGTVLHTLRADSTKRPLTDPISVAFSRDGKTVAVRWDSCCSTDISLWDVASGKESRTFAGHPNHNISVALSPDGQKLAIEHLEGGAKEIWEGAIELWDATSGTELQTLHGNFRNHMLAGTPITFSPDGQTLVSGGVDHTINLWDAASGKELRPLKGHSDVFTSLAFSPDGNILASGSSDGTVELWDMASKRALTPLGGISSAVTSAAFGPDEKTLVSGSSDMTIELWNLSGGTGERAFQDEDGVVESVGFSPEGKTIATGRTDGTIKLLDATSRRELHTLTGHSDSVRAVAFSPDGKLLAGCSTQYGGVTQGTVKLWNVASGKELRTIEWLPSPDAVAFSPNNKVLAISVNTDSSWIYGMIELRDVASGKKLRTLREGRIRGGTVESVAFSPDGRMLAVPAYDEEMIELWDVANGKELRTLNSGSVKAVTFTSDGKTLVSGGADHTIKLWDVASGKKLRTFNGHSSPINSVALSRDDQILVSGSDDASIKIWEVSSGRELASLIATVKDWLVVTPDGLFDGSPAAWNKIVWRYNNNTFDVTPVEAYFSDFYYPGLLSDLFAGKRPTGAKQLVNLDRRQIPVKLTAARKEEVTPENSRTTRLQIEVWEAPDSDKDPDPAKNTAGRGSRWWPASGARDLRLFRNGSLVRFWQGDLFELVEKDGCKLQSEAVGKPRHTICTATIPIVAGENKLTAYAFNHDNIKSEDAALTVTGADSFKRKGTLHILAVGVGRYANENYNLKYTPNDATSFAAQLKLQQEKLGQYQSVEIKTLLNEEAKKQNILADLKKLATTVQPEDAVVVYFSGHGKADGDHFYLVPHDLGYTGSRDQLSADGLKTILAHSISDRELEEAFRDIDAGQMFMIIDACNSGQALENKDEPRRGPMNTRGLAQLAYEKGMYILTASQNVEEAFVSEKLKCSYLTCAPEEGIRTNVADANHNGEVTLREWFDYASTRVPKLREETLEGKSLEEVTPTVRAAVKNQKSQTPRPFYRREAEARPFVVAKVGAK